MALAAGLAVCSAADLAWDRNPSPGVVGYRLFHGPASRVYTNAIDTGGETFVRGVAVRSRTFFSVVAYDALGLEGDFSEELVFTPVVLPLVVETSADLTRWSRLTNFVVFTSKEQAFLRLRVGE